MTLAQAEQAIATAFAKWTGHGVPGGRRRPVAREHRRARRGPGRRATRSSTTRTSRTSTSSSSATTSGRTTTPTTRSPSRRSPSTPTPASSTTPTWKSTPRRRPAHRLAARSRADGYDFESIVTHETGHFLGMAHSPRLARDDVRPLRPGEHLDARPAEDDVSGICAAYPPDGTRTTSIGTPVPDDACDPTPRHGFSTQCGQPQTGCVARESPGSSAPGSAAALAIAGVIACALGRRRAMAARSARSASARPTGRA